MKIGILTIFKSANYGAVLQATALNKMLSDMGYESEVINYLSPNHKPNTIIKTSRTPSIAIYRFLNLPVKKILDKKFSDFRNRNLNITPKYYETSEEIVSDLERWDKVICGSDQIWNLPSVGLDTTFLLDFIPDSNKKIAYAPSIGVSKLPEYLQKEFKQHLPSFKHLSVREKTGARLIKETCGLSAKVVLDPTLLLTKKQWLSLTKPFKEKPPYIFVYTTSQTKILWDFVKRLSDKTGCRIITANRGYVSMVKGKSTKLLSPDEFISYLANAEYVVTNSFHGTAFSLNFNKNLFVSTTKKGGPNNSSRMIDIMEDCNLSNRIIENNENMLESLALPEFTDTNRYLKTARNSSIAYLKNAIES